MLFSLVIQVKPKPLPVSSKEIGIDVGIKSLAVLSNGEVIDNPKHLKRSESKLKELQEKTFCQTNSQDTKETYIPARKGRQSAKRLLAQTEQGFD